MIFIAVFWMTPVSAQNVSWFEQEHFQHTEDFKQLTYVSSPDQPFLAVYLEHLANDGGGGGGNPTQTHRMYAYDTAGTYLWHYDVLTAPIAILSKEDDRFWVITYGAETLNTLNGTIPGSPEEAVRHLYFAEFDIEGTVTNSFVWGITEDVEMYINDICFDINGDFIFTGRLNPPDLSPAIFDFGEEQLTLDPNLWTHYVARATTDGAQDGISTFTGKRFGSQRGVITHLAQNSTDGTIVLAGRLNDTLHFETTHLVGASDIYQDLCLISFSENLEFTDARSVLSSTYGTLTNDLVYNAHHDRFYITGNLGNMMYLLDEEDPQQGHTGTTQNAYIASFSDLEISGGVYLIPGDMSNFERYITISNVLFDNGYNLLIVANVHENAFWIGEEPIQIDVPFAVVDYELVQFTMDADDFTLQDLYFSEGVGQVFARNNCYDPASEALYMAGNFNGDFVYGNIAASSTGGLNDAFILKQDLTETVTSANFEASSQILLFPNPASEYIRIETPGSVLVSVQVYDAIGKICGVEQLSSRVDVSRLSPGMYSAEIVTTSGKIIERFVKR